MASFPKSVSVERHGNRLHRSNFSRCSDHRRALRNDDLRAEPSYGPSQEGWMISAITILLIGAWIVGALNQPDLAD